VFRAKDIGDARYIFTHFATNWSLWQVGTEQFLLRQLPVALIGILVLECGQLLWQKPPMPRLIGNLPLMPRWALYLSFGMSVVMFGVYRKSQFIYFQF